MKKHSLTALAAATLLLFCTACGQAPQGEPLASSQSQPNNSAQNSLALAPTQISTPEAPTASQTEPVSSASSSETTTAKVRLTFGENEAMIRLVDNATTRDFVSRLPITQSFEDFNSIEKICRLPDALSVEGVEQGVDPIVADITLYVPWNTLVFYYKDFGYHKDLIPFGRVESGMDLLETQAQDFTVTMELVTDFAAASTAADNKADAAGSTDITMTVGETVITATLDDSETSKAFLATLPRTISMSAYGEREYYGRIEAISENGSRIPDFEDGDVTYYPAGPSFAVFYANSEQSDLPGLIRMGKLTSDVSVFETLGESVEVRIEVVN